MIVELKINGLPLTVDTSKLHESWIEKALAYGLRRLPNDTFSSFKGAEKYNLVKDMLEEMEKGGEAPQRIASGKLSAKDPVEALAWKNAKADLTAMFRAVTGSTKALDFAKHEKIAPFFKVTEDRATWIDESVVKWIEKQVADGKRDYMQDAKVALDGNVSESILDF